MKGLVRFAKNSDASRIASLHHTTLNLSFLSSLGQPFLYNLYQFLIHKEIVVVYEENNEIKGFVSFSANSSGMMKRFIINCPACLFILAFRILTHPANLKRFLETFRAPFKSKENNVSGNLPSGELLSISVNPNCQVSGIGSQLIKALEEYLKQNQIFSYKVVAGEELVGANKFYIKNGFVLVTQIKIHDNKRSNVYIKNL